LVTIERYGGGEFLKPSLVKIPSQAPNKTATAARGDDDTTIVGVYDIYCHPTVRGERTIGKSWGVAEFWIQINFYPKMLLGRLKNCSKNGAMSFGSTIIVKSEPYYYCQYYQIMVEVTLQSAASISSCLHLSTLL
jgi:hypothetical protein